MPPDHGTMSASEPPVKKARTNLGEERRRLPIHAVRSRLMGEIRQTWSVIVIGETGSGKSTQIPQYLLEAGLHKNRVIACTQPRRVAAITVAERVSHEVGCRLGSTVGYCVRFDDTSSPETRIRYMTDGMLLREAILDPSLNRYSVVILDEAHERTVHTDVLFGVVKQAQSQRRDKGMLPLKIIIMSATMDVDHFSQYFNSARVLYLEGRQFPIKVFYTREPQSDYIYSALINVFQVHKKAPPWEDILVFMTGQDEIESMVRSIRDVARDLPSNLPKLVVFPLYAALPPGAQMRAFQPTPRGSRKVIVSTNIAETSVTIHGIKFVIDSGMVKAKVYEPGSGLDLLRVVRVSQAQSWQRSGRAGRESEGTCYRLYTEAEFDRFKPNTLPEIQRCNMSSVVLQLLAMGIKDVLTFDFLDKPSPESLSAAVDQLVLLEAVDSKESMKLTDLGRKMASFPLDPGLAKCLIKAQDLKCLEEMLTVVSLLSVESVLHTPQNRKEDAQAVRKKFVSSDGDHLTLLNVYRAYKSTGGSKEWCFENFVNQRNVKTAQQVRAQLRDICVKQGLALESCGRDLTSVRRCLVFGFFMKTAELVKEGEYRTVSGHRTVSIHPSSALFQCKPGCVLYSELVKTSKTYMRNLCTVDPDWLLEAAPTYFKQKLKNT